MARVTSAEISALRLASAAVARVTSAEIAAALVASPAIRAAVSEVEYDSSDETRPSIPASAAWAREASAIMSDERPASAVWAREISAVRSSATCITSAST